MVLKNLPLTSGLFIVVYFLSAASAQKNLKVSPKSDLQSMEEILDLLRKVQLVFDMQIASTVQQGDMPDGEHYAPVDPNLQCSCSGLQCSCCHLVEIKSLGFRRECCLRVTYVHSHRVVRVSLELGNWMIFSKEVSVQQPPPVCITVYQIVGSPSVCIDFKNFHFKAKSVSGCAVFKATMGWFTLLTFDLGCFRMNVPDANQLVSEMKFPYLEGSRTQVNDPEPIDLGKVQMDDIKPDKFRKN